MSTLYNQIEEAQTKIRKGTDFLKQGLESRELIKFKNGLIYPRYCQYCVKWYYKQIVPIVCMFNYYIPNIEKMVKDNPNTIDDWMQMAHNQLLLKENYDTNEPNHYYPTVINGEQYIVYCPHCECTSLWCRSYNEALNGFHEEIKKRLSYFEEVEE